MRHIRINASYRRRHLRASVRPRNVAEELQLHLRTSCIWRLYGPIYVSRMCPETTCMGLYMRHLRIHASRMGPEMRHLRIHVCPELDDLVEELQHDLRTIHDPHTESSRMTCVQFSKERHDLLYTRR
jgi:hypothetical protein